MNSLIGTCPAVHDIIVTIESIPYLTNIVSVVIGVSLGYVISLKFSIKNSCVGSKENKEIDVAFCDLPQSTAIYSQDCTIRRTYIQEGGVIVPVPVEVTRRGQLWSKHPSWQLPQVSREPVYSLLGIEHVAAILRKYDIDPFRGFLPSQDPLQRLPYKRYHLWEDLGDDLPKLLGARLGQVREPLRHLPVIPTDKLVTEDDLRRAHLLLCLFAHAYVWGGTEPMDHIPKGIAVPLWEVSQRLGMPPVLGHPSIVLYNWRRLDEKAAITMDNLSTLNNFFDGRDESWFYLITVEIEAKGARAIVPIMLAIDAIQRLKDETVNNQDNNSNNDRGGDMDEQIAYHMDPYHFTSDSDVPDEGGETSDIDSENCDSNDGGNPEALEGDLSRERVAVYVAKQLNTIATAIEEMCVSLTSMREGCHPFIFYHRVRPFLSAWKHNPTLPLGVVYEGVQTDPLQFYGGSAAQSTLLPTLDIALGITHDNIKSGDFLREMRDYMPRRHREFLSYLKTVACIREFVTDCSLSPLSPPVIISLRAAYDSCIEALQNFRSGHISIASEYILAQQKLDTEKKSLGKNAGGKGTGGTDFMRLLKPIRDNVTDSRLDPVMPKSPPLAREELEKSYYKDYGVPEDIDLFRGATAYRMEPVPWTISSYSHGPNN